MRNRSKVTSFNEARKIVERRIEVKELISDFFIILAGILSAGFGLKGFLLPNEFLDGGATGISLLLAELTGIQLPILLVISMLPLFFWDLT
jgi:uncharacterized membrane-anchored protein YitT (DUF2179 family)